MQASSCVKDKVDANLVRGADGVGVVQLLGVNGKTELGLDAGAETLGVAWKAVSIFPPAAEAIATYRGQ